ncbi:MAG: molybdopterin biosynthesis protein [Deltaproteobacteria bacterium RBG_16_48_10]|nr:MAG: molybdopterin biosynthesis protein [Deltaproteobacteria bacterium RBG_16_48_10]
MKRNIYLKKKTLEEARAVSAYLASLIHLGTEVIPVIDASGRVTAEPIFAKISSPPFHCAAMDGIAVKAETTYGANEDSPKILLIGKEAFFVNTGNPIPQGMDAVIMIEEIHLPDSQRVEIREGAYPWQHVRSMGEDMIATEMVLPANHKITPYDLGALLASGHREILAKKKPRVGILPTGSELLEPDQNLSTESESISGIIESNSYVLSGLISDDGAVPIRHSILKDDRETIREALLSAFEETDLILVIAGSSAGSEDYSRSILEESGEVFAHGVSMMPGKPTLLGRIKNRPVIGIPGYPVSAIIAYEELVRPLIYHVLGLTKPERPRIKAFLTRKIPSKLGTEEFLRVKVGKVGDHFFALPLSGGSGAITSLTRADGIIRIPAFSEGLNENEETETELLKPVEEIQNTVVLVGSHDFTLDILASLLGKNYPPVYFSPQPVGSLGGILAVKNGICHLAGLHLLDPETGGYNFPYIRQYLKGISLKVIHLVYREQGLIVQKGNPKGIQGLEDLTRREITFINRQKGSGTRILLDHTLKTLSLKPDDLQGYEREESTHIAVASAVAGNTADAGLGILPAAKAMHLDFIPVAKERYDLIIPSIYFEDKKMIRVIETIRSEEFKERVSQTGGYDVSRTGEELTGD